MGRAVRLLFICLLAMALPLKGGAAVAMGGCSPVHSSMDIAAGEHDHPSASAELSTAVLCAISLFTMNKITSTSIVALEKLKQMYLLSIDLAGSTD